MLSPRTYRYVDSGGAGGMRSHAVWRGGGEKIQYLRGPTEVGGNREVEASKEKVNRDTGAATLDLSSRI